MKGRKSLYLRDGQDGTALVIVLAFIVLLTGLLVAYLSLSRTDRQLANSSFNGSKVDQLAVSALDVIIGDLKQEIVTGSTAATVNNETVYIPKANTPLILPTQNWPGKPPFGGTSTIPNLVRISSTTAITTPGADHRASNVLSTTASANGRSISLARWNQHYLVPSTATLPAPYWVYVTDTQGPAVITTPTTSVIGRYAYAIYDEGGLLNLNVAGFPSGTSAAQEGGKGGAAYADLTVLGLSQPQVDQIVGWRNYASVQAGGSFASFNLSGATQGTNYLNLVADNATNGFMKVAGVSWNGHTDQAFGGRQDLINFWTSAGLPTTALQYVGTFSREKNAPSWSPYYDAATLGGTAAYNYKTTAAANPSPAPTNPNVLYVSRQASQAGTVTDYALDGITPVTYQVQAGDPVIRRRFCLGRLAWLNCYLTPGSVGPNPAYAAAIKQHFGLVWGADPNTTGVNCWIYTSPDGTGTTPATYIKTLSTVAGNPSTGQTAPSSPREPDFFELLQAGILSGSVGMDAGAEGINSPTIKQWGPAGNTQAWDQTSAFQILQIGANIIDQYGANNYPTEIAANFPTPAGPITPAPSVYGVKNLPYLYAVYMAPLRSTGTATAGNSPTPSTNTTGTGTHAAGYFIPEVWNPHQNTTAVGAGPTQFRFKATGSAYFDVNASVGGYPYSPVTTLAPPDLNLDPGLTFSINPSEPTLLSPANVISSQTTDQVTTDAIQVAGATITSHAYIGICVGAASPDTDYIYYANCDFHPIGTNFFLQYLDPNGNWRNYSQMKALNETDSGNASSADLYAGQGSAYYYVKPDPRTDRFSESNCYQGFGGLGGAINRTCWPSYSSQGDFTDRFTPCPLINPATGAPVAGGKFSLMGTSLDSSSTGFTDNFYVLWQLSENKTNPSIAGFKNASVTYYSDVDGVNRRAEGAYDSSGSASGHPLATANAASRPVMLERPFRNVAEMGCAFRDEPWKNINFFTPESGDAGLLDLFSMDDVDVTAGKVNLNTRQPLVLQALLSGTTKMEQSAAATPISPADAQAIAATIATVGSSSTPFNNRAEIVNRAMSPDNTDGRFVSSPYVTLNFSSSADDVIKSQWESITRTLGDSTTTRTWNLMIDVVAQSGHYPPGMTSATQLSQFVVDGERRYWLHIAIDRFTGQVIDRVLEPVYE